MIIDDFIFILIIFASIGAGFLLGCICAYFGFKDRYPELFSKTSNLEGKKNE